jgi:hypothetical protein
MPLPIIPVLVGASALSWALAGVGAVGGGVAAYYTWDWLNDKRKERGLVAAMAANGEAGFRAFCFDPKGLGCSTAEEVQLLWEIHGPRIGGMAAKAAIQSQINQTSGVRPSI